MQEYQSLFRVIITFITIAGASIFSIQAQKTEVSEEVQVLVDKAWEFALASNDSALSLVQEALAISQKNDYPSWQSLVQRNDGAIS